jgi:hypothetical protein
LRSTLATASPSNIYRPTRSLRSNPSATLEGFSIRGALTEYN